MAAEIHDNYIPGGTLDHYAENEAGNIWYPVGQVFEAWATGGRDATDYAVAMVGDAGGNFVGTFDVNTSAGHYYVITKIRAGASAAAADNVKGSGEIWWNGTSEETQAEYELNAYDGPTNAEMELRTILAADYTVVSDLGTVQTADHTTAIADIPTNAELASAFTEIKGATWASGTDTLEAIRDRGDAAWTTGAGSTPPTVEQIRTEMDSNSTQLAAIVEDTNELQTNQYAWATATGFAVAGDAMTLADDAITASKYDQTTAFPLATEDSSATASTALNAVADNVTIFNLALGLLDEYKVIDGDTSSKQYDLCNRYYGQALQKALSKHPWNEAMKDTVIMQESVGPVGRLTYRYAVPSDSLQVRAIGHDLKHWEVKNGYIQTDYTRIPDVWATATAYVAGQYVQYNNITYLCDTSHTSSTWAADTANWTSQGDDYGVIDVEYIYLLTDTTLMSANLIDTIAQELAIKIATGITGNADAKRLLLEEYKTDILPSARSIDSVEGRLKPIYNSKWLRSRS